MLCNSFIKFALKRKTSKPLFFAPLQSETADKLLQNFDVDPTLNNTLYLLHQGVLKKKSSAVLRSVALFQGLWPLLYVFIIVPRFIRDAIYDLVARNRYKWFGKIDHCELLPGELTEGRVLN